MAHCKSLQDLSCEVAESFRPSGNGDRNWHTSGLIDFQAHVNRFVLDNALPLVTEGADEQVGRGRSQHIDRNTAAVLLDWNLRRLSQGRAVIDLRIGEFLVEFRQRHPDKLGYVRLPDYTREELGIPWRSASLLISNWTALSSLPLLKQAHREGKISKSKLCWLLRVVTHQNEEAWIEKASKLSVRALEDEVRTEESRKKSEGASDAASSASLEGKAECKPSDGGSTPSVKEERSGYLMSLETTPERAAIWDFALEHFRGHEGGNFSTAFFIEALLAEFCSAAPLPSDGILTDMCSNGARYSAAENLTTAVAGFAAMNSTNAAGGSAAGNSTNAAGGSAAGNSTRSAAYAHPACSVVPGYSPTPAGPVNPFSHADSAEPYQIASPESSISAVFTPPLPAGARCRRITGSKDDDFFLSGADGRELDEEKERWRALRRDLEDVTKMWEFLSWTPVTVETPAEWDAILDDARSVSDILKKLVAMRQAVGFYMGRLLRTVENLHLYADMHFASLNHYVVERLGLSMRTARNHIKLVKSFLSLPFLEKAFKNGDLTQERALLLLNVVNPETEREWLKYGIEVPVLDLEREARRLSRLIEADRNLLEKYTVLPGFETPAEKGNLADTDANNNTNNYDDTDTDNDSNSKASQDHVASSPGSPEASPVSGKICATGMLPDAAWPEDDDSPWEVRIRKDESDINDPSGLDSWKMVVTGMFSDENDPVPATPEVSDSPRKMSATEELPDAATPDVITPKTDDSPRKMSATEELPGAAPPEGADSSSVSFDNTATIRFFITDDLIPLWNYAFMRYIELVTGGSSSHQAASSGIQEIERTSSGDIDAAVSITTLSPAEDGHLRLEGFLFSLLYHYLEHERIYQKKKRRLPRHKVIERDGFRCMIPGCSSRCYLNDHHIKYRSHGGGDELSNNTGACTAHHNHCIHDNHYITVTGTAPDNLVIAMGVENGREPYAVFINGRRKTAEEFQDTWFL